MKKMLLVFVALALAGGGAFAQGWTFNGLASGGFGMFFLEGDDDVRVAPINWDAANTPFRTQLDARFANADNTAGLTFRIRAQGHTAGLGNLPAAFDWGFGWMSFMDNMITVQGGRVEYGFFAPLDRMHHQEVGGGIGVQTIVRPMDGLVLGFGAFSAGTGAMTLDGTGNTTQMLGTFQLSYIMPDLLRVTAGLRTASNVGTSGFGNKQLWVVTDPTDPTDVNPFHATPSAGYLSFSYLGMPGLHAAFTALFMNLDEFSDWGDMRFYATVGHTGLVENLDLRLGFSFGMLGNSDFRDADGYSNHIWVWLSGAYALSDIVVPRLDVHYVMGGLWTGFQQMHHWSVRNGATFEDEDSFIQIRPAVQFRVTAASFVELGAILNFDLGNENYALASWGPTRFTGHGTNIGVYALVRVSF